MSGVRRLILGDLREEYCDKSSDQKYDGDGKAALEAEVTAVYYLLGRFEDRIEEPGAREAAAYKDAVDIALSEVPDAVDGAHEPDVSCPQEYCTCEDAEECQVDECEYRKAVIAQMDAGKCKGA